MSRRNFDPSGVSWPISDTSRIWSIPENVFRYLVARCTSKFELFRLLGIKVSPGSYTGVTERMNRLGISLVSKPKVAKRATPKKVERPKKMRQVCPENFPGNFKLHSYSELARIYSVSPTTIWSWASKAGLTHTCKNSNSNRKFDTNRKELKKLLATKTYAEIGEIYGVSVATVYRKARKLGLKAVCRKSVIKPFGTKKLETLLKTCTYQKIADKYGLTTSYVYRWAIKLGLKR